MMTCIFVMFFLLCLILELNLLNFDLIFDQILISSIYFNIQILSLFSSNLSLTLNVNQAFKVVKIKLWII